MKANNQSFVRVRREHNLKTIEQHHLENWMKAHGKISSLYKRQKNDLKYLFNQLDTEKTGLVSVEELYDMFLSLGIVSKREDVEEVVEFVGSKDSGVLKFDEFVKIFEKDDMVIRNKIDKVMYSARANLRRLRDRDLPLSIKLSNRRRSLMIDAYVAESFIDRDRGMRVISAFADGSASPKSLSKGERIEKRQLSDFTSLRNRKKEIRGSGCFVDYLPPVKLKTQQLKKSSRVELMRSVNK